MKRYLFTLVLILCAWPGASTAPGQSPVTVVAWGSNCCGQTDVPVAAQSGVTAIVAGRFHNAALKSDGAVLAWGANGYDYGQTTVPVSAQSGVTAIAAGGLHTVALKSDGSVVAWGWNCCGQTTVPVAAQSGVTAIAAGGVHTVALKTDGSVVAWGWNGYAQTNVPVAAQSGVAAIAAGGLHTVALKTNGAVVAWGWNGYAQTNVPVAAQSGVAAIAAGDAHTVALKNNGSVVAWGENWAGQTNVPVAAQSGVMAIAAGYAHTVALKNDGSVVAWGYNEFGQTTVPAGLGGVTAIAAGQYHTVALAPTRLQFAAADHSVAENAGAVSLTVQRLGDLSGTNTVDYATQDGSTVAGSDYTAQSGTLTFAPGQTTQTVSILILNDGVSETIETFQVLLSNLTGFPARLGVVSSTVTILDNDTGIYFSAAGSVREDAGLATIIVRRGDDGTNTVTVDYATSDRTATSGVDYLARSGTLTFTPGEFDKSFTVPILNDGLAEGDETVRLTLRNPTGGAVLGGGGIAELTADLIILDNDMGFQFNAAHYSVWETGSVARITVLRGDDLKSAVTVDYATSDETATAGADYTARSGTLHFEAGERTQTILIPILDDGLDEGSETLNLTLTNPSAGVSLGANRDAVVAILDDERPIHIGRTQLKTIAAGLDHTLALKADGTLWAWGNDYSGQLGDGATETSRSVPIRVGTDSDWIAVGAGYAHSVGLKADGSLWAWGANFSGQLGDGTTINRSRPVRIGADNDWLAIDASESSALALKSNGSLWAWGSGWSQTGPDRVGTDSDWAAITAADSRSAALKQDASLWLIPSYEMPPTPQRVGTDNDWFTVAAGGNDWWDSFGHALALKVDGSLFAWGDNYYGQSGNGTNDAGTIAPIPIGSDKDWAALAAGSYHSAALKQDASLWTWGYNGSGELGIGTLFDTNRPARVGSDNDWVIVEVGYRHTVGLKSDGSLWAWGANYGGQLGHGTTIDANAPGRVGTDNDWAVPALPASEFRITSKGVGADGKFRLSFTTTNSFSYFILYRGTEVTTIDQPVDATLGPFVFQLSDPTPVSSNATAFYRVRAVPFGQPLDLDGDGIDDGYELRHRAFLNPFNPADAALDYDGDGRSNLQEYRDGTDPGTPPSPSPGNASEME
jgi:alpha-tubulin suppressor-like RCC1 family protein